MKKFIALMLSVLLVLSMAACGDSTPAQTGTTTGTTAGSEATDGTETTTAPQKETETTTAPQKETETTQATQEPTEPVATEGADETYFVKSGTPELGTVTGTSYVNEAASLTCAMPDDYVFASEEELLQMNEVTSLEELLQADGIMVAYGTNNIDSAIAIGAFKLGSEDVGGTQNIGEAILYIMAEDAEDLENDGATVAEPTQITVTFTAGKAMGALTTAASGSLEYTYLYVGYQFDEYMVLIAIQAPTEADVEELFLGVDVE